MLAAYRSLPTSFVRDIILKAPSQDMMNTLARSVLTLYTYDDRADDISLPNVLRQCLQLIALFPMLSVYGYQAYSHYHDGKSLYIHMPDPSLSTAEICFIFSVRTVNTPISRPTSLTLHWCCIWNMVVVTTLRSPLMWYLLLVQTPTLL